MAKFLRKISVKKEPSILETSICEATKTFSSLKKNIYRAVIIAA
jgi:hypothetical protein